MADLLVRLYSLPELAPFMERVNEQAVTIRPAAAYEKHVVVDWVGREFSAAWASECDVAFAHHPVSCLIATEGGRVIGFACHECTCRGFFGPIGVREAQRGRGIGVALLVASLHAMAAMGYAYAIIGSAGPTDFYRRLVGAVEIEGSTPGIYRDPLAPAE